MVVGIAQDAGYPQAGCQKECCNLVWRKKQKVAWVASLALIIPEKKEYYLIDATPDIKEQMHYVEEHTSCKLAGIFLTHAHMGHYTGLMHLGREAMGSRSVPVYVMPRMKKYLESNGPWSQLVELENIQLRGMQDSLTISIKEDVRIMPFEVPHRDEFSETVGFEFSLADRSGLYIPDIDKWGRWNEDISQMTKHDFVIIDGTFYRNGEIFGRDMSLIPHPFIQESVDRLQELSKEDKSKFVFTHFNHTNPAMWDEKIRKKLKEEGFGIAERGKRF